MGSGSGKTEFTKRVLLSALIQPSPERIIWCYGQWQPLYEDLRRRIPSIEFVQGLPDYLNEPSFIDVRKRNLIVLDDLMSQVKCDQRVGDLYTSGRHHRNLSVVYLTQNLFPQGKACRDIALNTQYLVLFNNPIDRQQVSMLARRIYPTNSNVFMKRYLQATSKPYGYLVVDIRANTPEQNRLRTDVFGTRSPRKRCIEDSYDAMSTEENDAKRPRDDSFINGSGGKWTDVTDMEIGAGGRYISPPGKRLKNVEEEERVTRNIWEKRFKRPLRESHQDEFLEKIENYLDEGYSSDKAKRRAANDLLPELRKELRRDLEQFLVDFHKLQNDDVLQQILQSAEKLREDHGMTVDASIKRAIQLRNTLFDELWPDHLTEEIDRKT